MNQLHVFALEFTFANDTEAECTWMFGFLLFINIFILKSDRIGLPI